ncbi:MAG: thioesterase family protein [Hyphomonadaceae bacterium]|nr:thioesterase family protein [Hyphomonadaceae bacterium]MBX3510230.1 thioesterase family protein [Hyphomonadaceae bacterium]
MSLASVVDRLAPEGDGFVIEAPEDWAQGRTLYGGMTAALIYEASRRAQGALPPLRSAQFSFIGPAAGKLRLTSTLLRQGRSSAMVAGECFNEEGAAARALFVFGAARESKVAHNDLPAPPAPAPESCGPFRKEGANAPRGFWNNFETRLAAGGRIFETAAPRPEFAVWTRFLDPGAVDPVTALLAIADCLPPAAMVHFPAPAPISTVTWTVDIAHTPASADAWRLLWSRSDHAGEGYSLQSMTMWDAEGRALAVGRQAVAIFA